MKIVVSGSHSTGKSTLIGSFVDRCPQYVYEPEAYEALADDIVLTHSEGPDAEGLAALLELTLTTLKGYPRGASVIFERSPIDYLAYAAATHSMAASERSHFLRTYVPLVKNAICELDLIVWLPISEAIEARPGEDEAFRSRVDDELCKALVDDEYGLLEGAGPSVVELSTHPERRLSDLLRAVGER